MSSSEGREDVQRTRTSHGLGAIRGTQFGQEMFDIELDGVQAEHQMLARSAGWRGLRPPVEGPRTLAHLADQ